MTPPRMGGDIQHPAQDGKGAPGPHPGWEQSPRAPQDSNRAQGSTQNLSSGGCKSFTWKRKGGTSRSLKLPSSS